MEYEKNDPANKHCLTFTSASGKIKQSGNNLIHQTSILNPVIRDLGSTVAKE